jgi:asparagine synthetase B (glutamine-hydrolysing)
MDIIFDPGNKITLKNGFYDAKSDIRVFYFNSYPFVRDNNCSEFLMERLISGYRRDVHSFLNECPPHSSVALLDFRSEKVILKDDEVGNCPLYFYSKEKILIDTHLRGIVKHTGPEIDRKGMKDFLSFGHVPGWHTLLRGIHKVPAGKCALIDRRQVRFISQHHRQNKVYPYDQELCAEQLTNIFLEFFAKFKDLEPGLMLSGGLDSGFLLSLLKTIGIRNIKTFTLGHERMTPGVFSDSRKLADYFSTRHFEIRISTKKYIDHFLKVLEFLDDLIFDIDLPVIFYAMQEISKLTKYIFHGMGSDDVFGKIGTQWSSKNNKLPFEIQAHKHLCHHFGVNIMFPYLDHRLLEFISRLPKKFKVHNHIDKYILRKASLAFVPKTVALRIKKNTKIPDILEKLVIHRFYDECVLHSKMMLGLFGKALAKQNEPSLLLKLIVFERWHNTLMGHD